MKKENNLKSNKSCKDCKMNSCKNNSCKNNTSKDSKDKSFELDHNSEHSFELK